MKQKKPVTKQSCRSSAVAWTFSAALWCTLVGMRLSAGGETVSAFLLLALCAVAAVVNTVCCLLWWRLYLTYDKRNPPKS